MKLGNDYAGDERFLKCMHHWLDGGFLEQLEQERVCCVFVFVHLCM